MKTTDTDDDDVRTDDLLRTGDDRVRSAAASGSSGAGYGGNDSAAVVAAAFTDHERAHDAIHQLHEDGFRDTWIGRTKYDDKAGYDETDARADRTSVTAPVDGETPAVDGHAFVGGEARVESDNWFMRLFGEGDESLHDALVRHGVAELDARRAGSLAPHSAIVTVDGANHPELAAEILSEAGGRVITSGLGELGYGTAGRYAYEADLDAGRAPDGALDAAAAPYLDATSYDDYGKYRAGVPIDESTRLQLRAERLRVDKSPVSPDEVSVSTDAITETRGVNVPIVREELFIERRPAGGIGDRAR